MATIQRHRVLAVDDDAGVLRTLQLILEDSGYTVRTAPNGREALQKLSAEPVDLVLTDLQMPVMGGLELLSELRARGLMLPVVFMSAGTNPRARAAACGADGYLAKPFDPDTLLELVQKLSATEGTSVDGRARSEGAGQRMLAPATPVELVTQNQRCSAWR